MPFDERSGLFYDRAFNEGCTRGTDGKIALGTYLALHVPSETRKHQAGEAEAIWSRGIRKRWQP